MLGKPDPMMMPGFPKETTFSVYLSLRNAGEKPLDVALQLNYTPGMGMTGGAPITRNLSIQHLASFEAKQVGLQVPSTPRAYRTSTVRLTCPHHSRATPAT